MSNNELNLAQVNVKKELAKAAVIGGVMCFVMSFLINYFIVGMPEGQMANAIGNGISGLGSGVMTALCDMGMFFLGAKKSGVMKKSE